MEYEVFEDSKDQVNSYYKGIGYTKFKLWFGFPYRYFCSKSERIKKDFFDELQQIIKVAKVIWDSLSEDEKDKKSYMRILKTEFSQFVKANGFHYKGASIRCKEKSLDDTPELSINESGYSKVELIESIKAKFRNMGITPQEIIDYDKKSFYKKFGYCKYVELLVPILKQNLLACREYGIYFN